MGTSRIIAKVEERRKAVRARFIEQTGRRKRSDASAGREI